MLKYIAAMMLLLHSTATSAQSPFNPAEYLDLLDVCYTTHAKDTPALTIKGQRNTYQRLYRSPELGLLNRWELWIRDDGTALISLRGTVMSAASWLENFYAAMVPATGSIRLSDSVEFKYRLAADEKASVHIGWTIGLAHLAPDILRELSVLMKERQTKDIIIFGHSQGGALAYLLTSYLYYRREAGDLPPTTTLRTYCSAPPKPGNLYYAYDFDFITRDGMAYAVINAADWVPETPGSVQTFGDLNTGSPLSDAETLLGKQKWPVNWILKSVYRKIKRAPEKTQKVFQKNFGNRIYDQVKKTLPDLKEPQYTASSNFMRAGSPIVLMPDEEYHKKFLEKPGVYFTHHLFEPYIFLMKKYYAHMLK